MDKGMAGTIQKATYSKPICRACSNLDPEPRLQLWRDKKERLSSLSSWPYGGSRVFECRGYRTFQGPALLVAIVLPQEEVKATAQAGCHICAFLSQVAQFFYSDCSRINLFLPQPPANPYLTGNYRNVQLYTADHTPLWQGIQPVKKISPDRLATESLDFVRRQLSICCRDHKSCKRRSTKLPTRLLDLGEDDQCLIQLFEVVEPLADVQYVALSYCWGTEQNIKTTVENYKTMQSGISASVLPRVILDAVRYTRALGLRFLWVDALCIIQDDHVDWRKVSVTMADIYANALLTLAAECSSSTSQGFIERPSGFQDIPQEEFNDLIPCDDGAHIQVHARALPMYTQIDGQLPTPRSTWSSRGWTLQEKLLSTRLLSFGHELEWVCQEGVVRESGCPQIGKTVQLNGVLGRRSPESRQEAFDLWHSIVEDYCKRSLTNCMDILPAISGLAKTMNECLDSPYLAGIWKNNFSKDILWRTTSLYLRDAAQPTVYLAPSFSWASIGGPISYGMGIHDIYSEYVSVATLSDSEVSPLGDDLFGQVHDGRLTLRGYLIKTSLVWKPKDYTPYSISLKYELMPLSSELTIDTALQATDNIRPHRTSSLTCCRLYTQTAYSRYSRRHYDGLNDWLKKLLYPEDFVAPVDCWLLYVGYYRERYNKARHVFLVLGKSPRVRNAYERIGLFYLFVGTRSAHLQKWGRFTNSNFSYPVDVLIV